MLEEQGVPQISACQTWSQGTLISDTPCSSGI